MGRGVGTSAFECEAFTTLLSHDSGSAHETRPDWFSPHGSSFLHSIQPLMRHRQLLFRLLWGAWKAWKAVMRCSKLTRLFNSTIRSLPALKTAADVHAGRRSNLVSLHFTLNVSFCLSANTKPIKYPVRDGFFLQDAPKSLCTLRNIAPWSAYYSAELCCQTNGSPPCSGSGFFIQLQTSTSLVSLRCRSLDICDTIAVMR